MTSTALGAETKKEEKIIFISDAHEKFYYEKLKEVRYQDVYHKALCYLVGNNVYMDLDMLCRKIQFKRTHSPVERSEIHWKIQRYKNKLKPDYAGKVCLEMVQCIFSLPENAAEKCRIVYDGQETYAFAMSNKYILGLFTHCEAARKSAVEDGVEFVHLPEEEQKIVRLENVRNVLFQTLLLDNVAVENGLFHAQMCTVMLLK